MKRSTVDGFTLIELMVIVTIIAILAAITVPSYQQYVRKNAQGQAESSMQALNIELERWRAKALSYRGFTPSRGWSTGNTVYIPYGSDATNHNYAVTILTVNSDGRSAASLSNATIANRWIMVARPRAGSLVENMPGLGFSSQGVKCRSTDSTIFTKVARVQNCGAGSKPW